MPNPLKLAQEDLDMIQNDPQLNEMYTKLVKAHLELMKLTMDLCSLMLSVEDNK